MRDARTGACDDYLSCAAHRDPLLPKPYTSLSNTLDLIFRQGGFLPVFLTSFSLKRLPTLA